MYIYRCLRLSFLSGVRIRFNQTGEIIAGKPAGGSDADELKNPSCLYIDANDTMYICDHHNDRVQKWVIGAPNATTVAGANAGTGATATSHAQSLTFDKNGDMYVTGHALDKVLRYSGNSVIGTAVAGSTSGSTNDKFNEPTDLYVDDNFNLYVVDSKNNRVMKWAQNATIGTPVISSSLINGVKGILPVPGNPDQVYLSDEGGSIYLWSFNASSPNMTLFNVTSSSSPRLGKVQRMNFDTQKNLFVADKDENRVVMYCMNSTVGFPVVGESGTTPAVTSPMDVAFDSKGNLYVALDGNVIVRYIRLP